MHHQEDKVSFVREAARILAPTGRLAIADVLGGSDVATWLNGPVDRATQPIGHNGMFLAHGELAGLMAEAGLENIEEVYHEYTWDFASVSEMVAYCKQLFRMSDAQGSSENFKSVNFKLTFRNFKSKGSASCEF